MRRITILFLLILFAFSVFATPDSSPIDWKLSGRLFLDGGVYIHSPKELHAGTHIADVRLAAKVRIYSNWYTKIDVGFANNKITLKDAFTEYGKDGNYFRAGYMLGYYSIDQSTSTNDLIFNTASNVAETFYPDRRIGISYTRSLPSYYLSAGAFCGDGLSFSETTKPGYNFSGRVVWRPVNSPGQLFHIGTGVLFKVPDENTETGEQQISTDTGFDIRTCQISGSVERRMPIVSKKMAVTNRVSLHENQTKFFPTLLFCPRRIYIGRIPLKREQICLRRTRCNTSNA